MSLLKLEQSMLQKKNYQFLVCSISLKLFYVRGLINNNTKNVICVTIMVTQKNIKEQIFFPYSCPVYISAGLKIPVPLRIGVVACDVLKPLHPVTLTTLAKVFGGYIFDPMANHNVVATPTKTPQYAPYRQHITHP